MLKREPTKPFLLNIPLSLRGILDRIIYKKGMTAFIIAAIAEKVKKDFDIDWKGQ